MAPTPGLLYVTMQPKPSLPTQQFHDWYNNEHGPTRLRLSFVSTGFRYRATDLSDQTGSAEQPEWLAWYDITDMAELTKETYTRLREPGVKSQRETDTMAQIHVNRKLFDFVKEWKSPNYKPLEDPTTTPEGTGNVPVSVTFTLKPGEEKVSELDKWYNEEHVGLLSKVPGWLRSRRYITSTITPDAERGDTEYMALHEYAPTNGLGGKEFMTAISTAWAKKIYDEVQASRTRRVYDLYYTFGPAPRELNISTSWTAPDKSITTIPASPSPSSSSSSSFSPWPAIESTITTPDGISLPYRLEGSSNPNAPLLLLSNSILVTYSIWDSFVSLFLTKYSHYRILRYNTRGRSALPSSSSSPSSSSPSTSSDPPSPITLHTLSSDILHLLNFLQISRATSLIGVSLGGATVLHTALHYPSRVSSFIACDTNSSAPPTNKTAWSERIALSESENAHDTTTDEAIVGSKLAEDTVKRWFATNETNPKTELKGEMERVKEMVAANSLDGFRGSVRALWEYDLVEKMREANGDGDKGGVRGFFVVGGEDGKLPGGMREMSESYGCRGGNGSEDGGEKGGKGKGMFEVVEGAGHLPMVERPEVFCGVVGRFLEGEGR